MKQTVHSTAARAAILAVLTLASPAGAGEGDIVLRLDPAPPSARGTVMRRGLFFAKPDDPLAKGIKGLGVLEGTGTVNVPFTVERAGEYAVVIQYGLKGARAPLTVRVDGRLPHAGWERHSLWPTTSDYRWGASAVFYGAWPATRRQVALPGRVRMSPGRHELGLEILTTRMVVHGVTLTTSPPPDDPAPWLFDNYVEFPALAFSKRTVERRGAGARVTLRGTWHNVAGHPVRYRVTSSVMPRAGADAPLFKVTHAPGDRLDLARGKTAPFEITVEIDDTPDETYSEMVQVVLHSEDVEHLRKPYLMLPSLGYRGVNPAGQIHYTKGGRSGDYCPDAGASPRHVIPTRASFGYRDGNRERDLDGAMLASLAAAPEPVMSRPYSSMRIDFTAWARAGGPNEWYRFQPDKPQRKRDIGWRRDRKYELRAAHPLARILAGLGQNLAREDLERKLDEIRRRHGKHPERARELAEAERALREKRLRLLKDVMVVLADELPFYPVYGRWDQGRPLILPYTQWGHTGVAAAFSYVRALQEKLVSDDEHFRFLHNVILPHYLSFRIDMRVGGTLARRVKAGDDEVQLAIDRAEPHMNSLSGGQRHIRVGAGATAEFVQIARGYSPKGNKLDTKYLGTFEHDHAAGEPWVYYAMGERHELECVDLGALVAFAVAGRDAALAEQCGGYIATIFREEELFHEDGSFLLEPGSYGWAAYEYAEMVQQIRHFLGRDAGVVPDELVHRIRDAMIAWCDFPFSNGTFPMLNGGGARNQLGRTYKSYASDPRCLYYLKEMFPDQREVIARYEAVVAAEREKKPGAVVPNRSFKKTWWGYAMLRAPGPWDRRMETLVSSKHLFRAPGDHNSRDCMGICLYAHGAIMTPRYGYHWVNDLDFFVNRVRIGDHKNLRMWGDYLHFDPDRDMPSAVVYTDMCGRASDEPGPARQVRWLVQTKEYLFDAYEVRMLDKRLERKYRADLDMYEAGTRHTWGPVCWSMRNLGELSVVWPQGAKLRPAKNMDRDRSPWEPFGYYRKNTKHEGMSFVPAGMWKLEWTMNQGGVREPPEKSPYPPAGARMRLTMAASEDATEVITAWLEAPGRNERAQLRQDFVVARRVGTEAVFVDTIEPIAPGAEAYAKMVEVAERNGDGTVLARVDVPGGADWYVFGGVPGAATSFPADRVTLAIGPITTNASLAAVRVRDGRPVAAMIAGGSNISIAIHGRTVSARAARRGTHHFSTQDFAAARSRRADAGARAPATPAGEATEAPKGPAPAAPPAADDSSNALVIGAVLAAIVVLVLWLGLRKRKTPVRRKGRPGNGS